MAKFEVKNSEGKKVAEAELAAEVYGIEPNIHGYAPHRQVPDGLLASGHPVC
mgnify:CR=1 FL=1